MRAAQSVGHLENDADGFSLRDSAPSHDVFGKISPVDVFHDKVAAAVLDAKVECPHDVRMAKPAGGNEFLLKPLDQDGMGLCVNFHDLDGGDLGSLLVARAVNRS